MLGTQFGPTKHPILRLCACAHNRKAWLFSDTPEGARASAAHYSLIETAKLHGLEPFRYCQHILAALPCAEKIEDFEAFLPWNVKEIM